MAESLLVRFWSKVDKSGGADACWTWTRATTGGRTPYGFFSVNRRSKRAHRVSWELTNGPIPDGLFVCHHCDNPPCVNPAHLFLGTNRDNMDDMMAKGRQNKNPPPTSHRARGERNAFAKLSADRVREMRRLRAGGMHFVDLGKMFGVSISTAQNAALGRTWKHIDGAAPSKGRPTHCIHGHEFTAKNTKIRPNGTRQCRACDNARRKERSKRRAHA